MNTLIASFLVFLLGLGFDGPQIPQQCYSNVNLEKMGLINITLRTVTRRLVRPETISSRNLQKPGLSGMKRISSINLLTVLKLSSASPMSSRLGLISDDDKIGSFFNICLIQISMFFDSEKFFHSYHLVCFFNFF